MSDENRRDSAEIDEVTHSDDWPRPSHGVHQTPAQRAAEPAPFPVTSATEPVEMAFTDWRERLTRNLASRSDRRWEPLTSVHARDKSD